MSHFMLSFTKGTPIAQVIDKNDKVVHIIRVREDLNDEKPDILTNDIFDILRADDITKVSKLLKLNRIEKQVLKKAIGRKSSHRLNPKLKEGFDLLIDVLNEKIKKELDFDEGLRVLPVLGHKETPFDRHIFSAGASGSGKSYLIGDILKFDERKRPIMLFSKVLNDPAFSHLLNEDEEDEIGAGVSVDNKQLKKKKINKKKRLKHFVIEDESSLLELPAKEELVDKDGLIMVFDDIDTFRPEITDYLRQYQNDILETGRHHLITTISTSHELKGHTRTKKNLNEAEFIILFPSTNQMLSNKFLRDSLGLLKQERENILRKTSRNRYMIVKTSSPLAVMHERGIILL